MKFKSKHLNVIVSMFLLIVAVFSAINVSYSYFTSKASKSGNIEMGALQTYFRYQTTTSSNIDKGNVLELYAEEEIEIGVKFNFGIKESETVYKRIENLSIFNHRDSCECYVRFWIEAYVVESGVANKSIDYGRFFAIETYNIIGANGIVRGGVENAYCYFIKNPLGIENGTNLMSLGNTLILQDIMNGTTLVEAVPTDILGEDIEILLSFEAVQNGNRAFESVFNDQRGHYDQWT